MRKFSHVVRQCSSGLQPAVVLCTSTRGGNFGHEGIEKITKTQTGILATEERVASMIADSVRPRLVPDIEILPWRKTHVLVVQVFPSSARPHYLERLGPEAGVFVRLGSTNRRADAAQLDEMRQFGQLGSFDEQPIPELNSEALDFRAASELFAPVRKLAPSAFHSLRVTTKDRERDIPTVGGFLLFGKNRFECFPDAWVQAGRFAGKNRAHILDFMQCSTAGDPEGPHACVRD